MYYYQFNIGDYQSHTGHLEPLEDCAYRRMLDWCYLHERPLPDDIDQIAKLIRMRSHSDCIANVLREFFVRTADGQGWWQERIGKEIAKTAAKSEKAAQSAKARWDKEKTDANALPPQSERNATHNPLPNTHNPIPNKKATVVATPFGVSDSVWQDFVKHRKTKKAQVTQTVIDGIRREAEKAGWTLEDALRETIVRNWQSFKAEWVADKTLSKTGETNQKVLSGLTRGLIGGAGNVKLLG